MLIAHLELCQKFGLVGEVKWYNHKPAGAVENDRVKILWDFNIQTDHVIQHRRPDIVVLYKNERKCHLIDITMPGDKWIELKEQEKIVNYSKLRQEVKKIWNLSQVFDLKLVGTTCSLGNILNYQLNRDKHNNNKNYYYCDSNNNDNNNNDNKSVCFGYQNKDQLIRQILFVGIVG